jgi:hypothetical protein
MKRGLKRTMDEFGIKKNIKEEFCIYTDNKIKYLFKMMDKKFSSIKAKIEEKLQTKLVRESEKIEKFSNVFC